MAHLSDLDLMCVHVETVFPHTAAGKLRRRDAEGALAPVVFYGRTMLGSVLRVREDIEAVSVELLESLAVGSATSGELTRLPAQARAFTDAAVAEPARAQVWSGPAYVSEDTPPQRPGVTVHADLALARRYAPALAARWDSIQPVYCAMSGDVPAAVCFSARISDRAAEAGVETHSEFRHRGLATSAATAWVRAIQASGKLALYSTWWDNLASIQIARRLGMRCFGVDFHVTDAAGDSG